jgi:ribosomal subunit interface protein
MDIPLEISFHNTEPSEALEKKIRDRVNRLHRYFARINSCRVAVEVPHRSAAQQPQAFHIRIETRVPTKELVVSHDPGRRYDHFNANLAVRDAFEAMERQLEEHSRKMRNDVKTHDVPIQGRVLRTFADHGFIATTDGREIYFHRNTVVDARFEDIGTGDTVALSVAHGESPAGPQATTVRAIRPMEIVPDPSKRSR